MEIIIPVNDVSIFRFHKVKVLVKSTCSLFWPFFESLCRPYEMIIFFRRSNNKEEEVKNKTICYLLRGKVEMRI